MGLRRFGIAVGASLAFMSGAGLAVALAWTSMRSLYHPGTGARLLFDAGVGILLGVGLCYGAWRLHRALHERDAATVGLLPLGMGATVLGVALAALMASYAWSIAHDPSLALGLPSLDHAVLFALGATWAAGCLVVVGLGSRTWRGYLTAVSLTAGAIGAASVLFSMYLWATAHQLRAAAVERNQNVPGLETALLAAALSLVALARARRRG